MSCTKAALGYQLSLSKTNNLHLNPGAIVEQLRGWVRGIRGHPEEITRPERENSSGCAISLSRYLFAHSFCCAEKKNKHATRFKMPPELRGLVVNLESCRSGDDILPWYLAEPVCGVDLDLMDSFFFFLAFNNNPAGGIHFIAGPFSASP